MRWLAALLVVALLVLPLTACGGGGGSFCSGICGTCTFSEDCCDFSSGAVCSNATGSGSVRCIFAAGQCKLDP